MPLVNFFYKSANCYTHLVGGILFIHFICVMNQEVTAENIAHGEHPSPTLVIAFDAKRLFNNFTGLGNYSRTLLKNLQTYFPQHEYHLFAPKVKKNDETAYFLDSSKFIIHTPKNFHPLWRTIGMSAEVNALKPDIFHGLSHEIPFGLNSGIKTLVTFHDLIYEKFPDQFGWWDKKLFHYKYTSSAKRTDHIAAISESTKNDLTEMYHIPQVKISVIYQSCNDIFQDETSDQDNLLVELAGIQNYYLYVGSLIERKGLLQIVIAFAQLPEEYRKPLVVVGNGNKTYKTKVTDLIRYYGLEEYFYFIDRVSNQNLISVYDHCFALIYPSIYEGFGIPVIEALFRYKPVITSDISSLPEAAGPGAILVNPYSPDDIAQAMIWLHDKKAYQELSSKGHTYVKSRFSSEETARSMMELYHVVLE
jgi:glycosyltransferase involved in cell wall biosynthesis